MAGQHAAQHDKISTAAKGFRYVARHRTTAIANDLAAEAMRRISTFDHRRQLRITDTGFHAGRADRAWTNTDFNNVGAGQDKFFHHFSGDDVTGTDNMFWAGFARFLQESDKMLGIAIGYVDTDKLQLG